MIRDVKVGQEIKVKEEFKREEAVNCYTVEKVYPFHVLAKRYIPDTGEVIRRSFSYGDLIIMGLEKQEARYESMRRGVV